jgi:hypothetical protein
MPNYPYHHEDGRLTKVKGAIAEDSFNSSKTVLPPLPGFVFDACVDFDDYRRNSYRGRRRSHALHLAAHFRQQNVVVFEKWLDENALKSFESIINKLKALVQGVRVTFPTSQDKEIYYQINKPMMESLYRDLELIRNRTMQLNKGREEDILELPIWSDATLPDIYKGVYSRNDWEILAATFRQEAETYLLAALYCNYDFKPVDVGFDQEEEEYCEPFVPKDLSPEVTKLIEDSMRIITRDSQPDSSVLSGTHHGISSVPSQHRQDPSLLGLNIDSGDGGGQGELTTFEDAVSSSPKVSSIKKSREISLSGKAESTIPSTQAPLEHSRPTVSFAPVSQTAVDSPENPKHEQFAPIDPVGQQNIVPDFQVEQINRMYQAPPENMEPVIPGTGTETFNKLFQPNRYAEAAKTTQSQASSQVETPGRARSAFDNGSLDKDLPSVPGTSFNSRDASNDNIPTFLSRPSGLGTQKIPLPSIGPSGPPGNDPDDDDDDPDGPHPPHPPSGPPGGFPPRKDPNRGQPHSGGPPGPPGPPDSFPGGAAEPNDGKPKKDYIITGHNKFVHTHETHFDTKLKPDIIPTWNGDDTSIIRWLTQIDELAQRSASVFKGLGDIVPTRFREKAAAWWFSLPSDHRNSVTSNWDSLKKEIRAYWMNQSWIEKAQIRANQCRYRESGHSTKTPTKYVIQKLELLSYVYNYTLSQTMSEILLKAPRMWSTVVNPRHYQDLASFQTAIKYHEDLLMDLGDKYDRSHIGSDRTPRTRSYKVEFTPRSKVSSRNSSKGKATRSYAVGWNNPKPSYPHPRDDSTVSKGKTPADYGARGCIFCGSKKHWDRDCKHFKSDTAHKARAMFTDCSPDEMHAEAEYERCYQNSQEDLDEEPSSEEEIEAKDDHPENHSGDEQEDF